MPDKRFFDLLHHDGGLAGTGSRGDQDILVLSLDCRCLGSVEIWHLVCPPQAQD